MRRSFREYHAPKKALAQPKIRRRAISLRQANPPTVLNICSEANSDSRWSMHASRTRSKADLLLAACGGAPITNGCSEMLPNSMLSSVIKIMIASSSAEVSNPGDPGSAGL
jgi:hypothetical protein